jgi:hypothetical protein
MMGGIIGDSQRADRVIYRVPPRKKGAGTWPHRTPHRAGAELHAMHVQQPGLQLHQRGSAAFFDTPLGFDAAPATPCCVLMRIRFVSALLLFLFCRRSVGARALARIPKLYGFPRVVASGTLRSTYPAVDRELFGVRVLVEGQFSGGANGTG